MLGGVVVVVVCTMTAPLCFPFLLLMYELKKLLVQTISSCLLQWEDCVITPLL